MPDLSAGGLKIHYVDTPPLPQRPTVVFLHGAAANHTIWLAVMKALRGRVRVVVPDLPGHGRSDTIPGRTVTEYAQALIPFLERLAEGVPLVAAGHSMGGAIAMEAALARPGLSAGLVLAGSSAKFIVSPAIFDGLRENPSETQGLIARWQFAKGTDLGLVVRSVKDLVGTSIERTIADFRACAEFDIRERLSALALPALVLCGSEDRMTRPAESEFLAQELPRATLRLVEGAGHALMLEKPEEVAGAIAGFVESL